MRGRYGDDGFVPRGTASGASGDVGSLKLRDAVLGDPGVEAEFPATTKARTPCCRSPSSTAGTRPTSWSP
ncbi:MAG: hypothetical protein WKF73_18820 [Nocardioidaceae bacterium]